MTYSSDTPKPKKPILSVAEKIERINEEADNPHFALYLEWLQVLDERAEEFDLDYMGILGAIKLLENDITQEMNDVE